jgi:hypothetical protein
MQSNSENLESQTLQNYEKCRSFILEKIQSKYKIQSYVYGKEDFEQNDFETLKSAKEVVIGDIHGDLSKLLEHLILADILTFDHSDLEAIYDILEVGEFENSKKMQTLSSLLSKFELPKSERIVRLLGDIIGDRKGNDLVMIKFLNLLTDKGLNLRCFVGNHDHNSFVPEPAWSDSFRVSLLNAQRSVVMGHYQLDQKAYFADPEVLDKYRKYISRLRIMEFDESRKIYYGHAPVYESTFKKGYQLLAKNSPDFLQKSLTYEDCKLTHFANMINQSYRKYARKMIEDGGTNPEFEQYLFNMKDGLLFSANGGKFGVVDVYPTFHSEIQTYVNGHFNSPNSPSRGIVGNDKFQNICLDNEAGLKLNLDEISPVFLIQ